ncbi:MAG TPA: methyltransferase domain-containing protein [Azospirillum sp.]
MSRRNQLSLKYLRGHGLEVGPLNAPLPVGDGAKVTYVDRLPVEELRRHYPELGDIELFVDVVDDGEVLATVPPSSQDFIIANHMLEHCENPLGTLRHHLSKVKPGGVLYYAIPDKRFTFDRDRALTPFDHLVLDDMMGVEGTREAHYRDYVLNVDRMSGADAVSRIRHLMDIRYSIHFHVWDHESYGDFLRRAAGYLPTPFEILELEFIEDRSEAVAILRTS